MSQDVIDQYREAVERIHALLKNFLVAGVAVYLELHKIEQSGVWKHFHIKFRDFLQAEFPQAIGLVRYRTVMNAIHIYGVERVQAVGFDCCPALVGSPLIVRDAVKRGELERQIDQYFKVNRTPPPAQEILRMRREILNEPKPPSKEAVGRKLVSAATEIARLEVELAAARERILELETQNSKLQAALKRAKARASELSVRHP